MARLRAPFFHTNRGTAPVKVTVKRYLLKNQTEPCGASETYLISFQAQPLQILMWDAPDPNISENR